MDPLTCDAIIFDLDGVLVDSSAVVERCWTAWAKDHGLSVERVLRASRGRRIVETVRALAPELDAEAEAARLAAREAQESEGLRIIPGAAALFRSVPASRRAIATSGQRAVASFRLAFVGLPQPEVLVTADDVTRGKPHPEPYLKAARALGYAPETCLVLEDAPAGLEAAEAAGMRTIGVTTAHPPGELERAEAHVADLRALRAEVLASGALRVFCS